MPENPAMNEAEDVAGLAARQHALADTLERTSIDLLEGAVKLARVAQAEQDPARRAAIEAEIVRSRRDAQRYLQEVWAWRDTGEIPAAAEEAPADH